ncbi:MAG: cysteine hydrolase [Lachnospiraceae bacterium]|nr:cysteine hydrolase [Lachnospiraceae bacterium]
MAQTLIVIDMQKDFVDGALGTKEAVGIVENVKAKIKEYVDSGRQVIFTRDTHHEDYLETNEGKHLPVVHCIEGTPGWEIYDGVYAEGCDIINKPAFGYTGWGDYSFESVELIGLCTDICVVSNALIIKALFPEISVSVDPSCCAGVTPEAHQKALDTMASCQVEVAS